MIQRDLLRVKAVPQRCYEVVLVEEDPAPAAAKDQDSPAWAAREAEGAAQQAR